jgi:hypothetical protein
VCALALCKQACIEGSACLLLVSTRNYALGLWRLCRPPARHWCWWSPTQQCGAGGHQGGSAGCMARISKAVQRVTSRPGWKVACWCWAALVVRVNATGGCAIPGYC